HGYGCLRASRQLAALARAARLRAHCRYRAAGFGAAADRCGGRMAERASRCGRDAAATVLRQCGVRRIDTVADFGDGYSRDDRQRPLAALSLTRCGVALYPPAASLSGACLNRQFRQAIRVTLSDLRLCALSFSSSTFHKRNRFFMTAEELKQIVITALEDLKGQDIIALDVQKLTNVTDYMVFCSGTSNRQVKSLADNAQFEAKKRGAKILGSEGELEGEWVLVDLGDVIVHVMLPETRAFYDLERMWSQPAVSAPTPEQPPTPAQP